MSQSLWQKPQFRPAKEDGDRHATWLELFFDLVFVVAIAQLAHVLYEQVSIAGLLQFALLFVPVWWCWVGAVFYATRFDTNDFVDQLFCLMQMSIVAFMAATVHSGLEHSVAFALCYIAFRGVLVAQYLYSGYHIPRVRPLTTWYAIGFGLSIGLWMISIIMPAPWRYGLWILGMIIDFSTPLTAGRLVARFPPSMTHVPERVGLFTIIVLGEAIASTVRSLTESGETQLHLFAALSSLVMAFSLWWLYFNTVDGSPLRAMQEGRMNVSLTWLYTHLPLTMGLVAIGVGIERVIDADLLAPVDAADRWLLCLGLATTLTMLSWIHLVTCSLGVRRRKIISAYRLGGAAMLGSIAIIDSGVSRLGLSNLSALALILLTTGVCVIQVGVDLRLSQQPLA